MNFSKHWVRPRSCLFSSSPLSPPSPGQHPCMRQTIHHVHIEKGFLVHWESDFGLPGKLGRDLRGDAAEGKSHGFTGDMKHWMLNSSLNRSGIVTRNMKKGGGHNIIHVKHLSRACISNAKGAQCYSLVSYLFSIFFHPF